VITPRRSPLILSLCLLVSAASGAAAQTGHSSASPSQCTAVKARPGRSVALRPTARGSFAYGRSSRTVLGRRVAVHWVSTGPQAPPGRDSDRDGVPNYVEMVRDVADHALEVYRQPVAPPPKTLEEVGPRWLGFLPPPCDVGGPNKLPDVYIVASGAPGRAFAPTVAQDGAFVVISNQLHVNTSKVYTYGSLAETVAHELFHLVQYAYVPRGMAKWLAESSANFEAFEVTHDESAAFFTLATETDWWKRPWASVIDPNDSARTAYGANWLWWYDEMDLVFTFERLQGLTKEVAGDARVAAILRDVNLSAEAYLEAVGVGTRLYIDTASLAAPPGSPLGFANQAGVRQLGELAWHLRCEVGFQRKRPGVKSPDGTIKPFAIGIRDSLQPQPTGIGRHDAAVYTINPVSCSYISILNPSGKAIRIWWKKIADERAPSADVVLSLINKDGRVANATIQGIPGNSPKMFLFDDQGTSSIPAGAPPWVVAISGGDPFVADDVKVWIQVEFES
jgi:hypothetical protein